MEERTFYYNISLIGIAPLFGFLIRRVWFKIVIWSLIFGALGRLILGSAGVWLGPTAFFLLFIFLSILFVAIFFGTKSLGAEFLVDNQKIVHSNKYFTRTLQWHDVTSIEVTNSVLWRNGLILKGPSTISVCRPLPHAVDRTLETGNMSINLAFIVERSTLISLVRSYLPPQIEQSVDWVNLIS